MTKMMSVSMAHSGKVMFGAFAEYSRRYAYDCLREAVGGVIVGGVVCSGGPGGP